MNNPISKPSTQYNLNIMNSQKNNSIGKPLTQSNNSIGKPLTQNNNPNRKPLTQTNLNRINSYDARQNLLLKHNFVFYGTIMAAIAAKNKLDFPPFGPRSDADKKFQNDKIKLLLQAIIEKTTSGTGYKTDYPLAEVGAVQGVAIASRAAASKVMGAQRFMSGWWSGEKKKGGSKKSYTKS